jgi:hypothetical protein
VESSCKLGNEPSGSIKCWELPNGCTTCGLSSGTQPHSYLVSFQCFCRHYLELHVDTSTWVCVYLWSLFFCTDCFCVCLCFCHGIIKIQWQKYVAVQFFFYSFVATYIIKLAVLFQLLQLLVELGLLVYLTVPVAVHKADF